MKTLYIDNTILTQDKKKTYLSSTASSGAGTLTVLDIVGFAVNQILCIGEIGEEKTEIIKTHSSIAPSGTTITLKSNLIHDHSINTSVYIIDWNQIEISHASTTTGVETILDTIAIQVDQEETLYNETTQNSGYYFTRFKNDITNIYSDYSDAIPYTGYGMNTVFSIKERALKSIHETIGELITHEFLNEALWEGRRELHNAVKRWSFRRAFNHNLGNVSTGMYRIAVPIDLQDPNTAKNVFGVRIGHEKNLDWYTKKEWDKDYEGINHTTLASNYTVGDSTITLTNSRDFDESGSINIENDTISYSANNKATGVLTVSIAGNSNHSAGVDVWQGASFGLPTKFTVFDGYIYFNCPIHNDYVNQNIWIDYYKQLVEYDSDADELDEPEYDMFVNYLAWKIKKRKNEGIVNLEDDDYLLWTKKKNDLIKKEILEQEISLVPDIEHLL